jgi:hypothetical protein
MQSFPPFPNTIVSFRPFLRPRLEVLLEEGMAQNGPELATRLGRNTSSRRRGPVKQM